MGTTPRNGIEVHYLMPSMMEAIDTLFEICDAEFNSRKDVHESFKKETSSKKWSTQFLFWEVRKIAAREDIICSAHIARIISDEISCIWHGQHELQ